MRIVLLSGGSGKRLWPLSNDSRSKQFLKVLKNEGEGFESMVQRVWRQLEVLQLTKSTVIATSKAQVDMLQNQVGSEVPLIIEPERRDTFPAIALATTYLHSIQNIPLDEVVCVLPVDSYVENLFFEKVKSLEKMFVHSNVDLALVGAKPTYASSKYGYIIPRLYGLEEDHFPVNFFKEKPSEEEAGKLIEKQALWNCGVFAFKMDYMISLLDENHFPTHYQGLLQQYDKLPNRSFDYEVVEKSEHTVVVPYDGYWKDLGTWNTLTEEMATNQIGKGIISKDSKNTHLVNELGLPITVLGVSDAVIAAGPDGILVSNKQASPRLKSVMKGFVQRPMYEERRWGWYRVLDYTKYNEGQEVLTKRVGLRAGKNLSYQLHHKRNEMWTVIKGEGDLAFDGEIYRVKVGSVLSIPAGVKHGLRANTEMEFIEVQTGSELNEEDVVRIFTNWLDIETNCNLKSEDC